MQGRNEFIDQTLEVIEELLLTLEDREEIDPDMNVAREAAEVLREELRVL